jgi:DNA-binding MarR family transcriptional regulator/GNAT superfamily N-acetyltransferase
MNLDDAVERFRRFTRFYTRRMGILQEALLGSAFTLAEGRIVYEIARRERTTASDLVATLELDRGYVSRLVKGLEERGILVRNIAESDARQNLLALTRKGRREFDQIDQRSNRDVKCLLEPLSNRDCGHLVASFNTIEQILDHQLRSKSEVIFRDLRPGDIGWIVHRHGILYATEYGWDNTFEALVAKVGAEFIEKFDSARERAFVAASGEQIVGSVFLSKKSETIAKLRLLYVEPAMRSQGIGRRLVEACIDQARGIGYKRMTLWTNDVLVAARKIYQATGFTLVHQERHFSFGKELLGETWEREL